MVESLDASCVFLLVFCRDLHKGERVTSITIIVDSMCVLMSLREVPGTQLVKRTGSVFVVSYGVILGRFRVGRTLHPTQACFCRPYVA